MDPDVVGTLKDHFALFLKYLLERKKDLFLQEYENATAQYIDSQKSFF